jgi:hypothetical protein
MPNLNPIAKLQSVEWSTYRSAAISGQIASALIIAITATALAIIVISNTQAFYTAASYPEMITLGVTGGLAFVTFVICSCMHCAARYKKGRGSADQSAVQEQRRTIEAELAEPITIKVTASLDKEPVEYVKQALVQPLLQAFKKTLKALVVADLVKSSSTPAEIAEKSKKVDEAFQKGERLFNFYLDNPTIYVSELLRFFGPGKMPLSIALRRLIAAYNSGDAEKFAEIKNAYQAIVRGHDLTDIKVAFRNQSRDALMTSLPTLLESHFSLVDDTLKGLGKNILIHIFDNTKENREVLTKLDALKKKGDKLTTDDVGAFLKLVLEKANVSPEQYKEWNEILIKQMINTTFKKSFCVFLGMVARNIRILSLMFDKKMKEEALFNKLDETFLLSESADCIGKDKECFQGALFELQSKLNHKRDCENRIALIALPKNNTASYEELMAQDEVIGMCYSAHKKGKSNFKEYEEISYSAAVLEGRGMVLHDVRLVAVPVSLSDHPFKDFKKKEKAINFVAWAAKTVSALLPKETFDKFLAGKVRPKLMQILPKMDEAGEKDFDSLLSLLINLMVNPIYDGAIGDTPFRKPFERIITTQGGELARKVEELLLLDPKKISFEKISDVWTKSMEAIAKEFSEVE